MSTLHKNLLRRVGSLAGAIALSVVSTGSARIQPSPLNVDTVLKPTDAFVTIDGILDDEIWDQAESYTPFRSLDDMSKPSALKSTTYVAIKGNYLYIAYRLEEPNMSAIKAVKLANTDGMQDTRGIYADDCTETFISLDRETAIHITVNAAGTKNWSKERVGEVIKTWYPISQTVKADWDAQSAKGDNEWTCEMRICLSDIFEAEVGGTNTLYMNFARHRTAGGKEEHFTWTPLSAKRFYIPKDFPSFTLGLPPIKQQVKETSLISSVFSSRLSVPDLLIAGVPVKLNIGTGSFELPSLIKITDKTQKIDAGVQDMLRTALTVAEGKSAEVLFKIVDQFNDTSLSAEEIQKLQSSEAFELKIAPGKIIVSGRTDQGVLRGIATLILMAKRAQFAEDTSLPVLDMLDAPGMDFRGWVVLVPSEPDESSITKDAAFKRSMDLAYLLRFNKVFFRINRWMGKLPFPFESFPIGDNKRTKQDWAELADYARARGLDPQVEFQCWNGVQFFKSTSGGTELLIDEEGDYNKAMRNLDVANPDARNTVLRMMEEVVDTIKPTGVNISLDELHYAPTVTSPAAKALNWKVSDWMIEAISASHKLLSSKGVKLYIFGDMIDPTYNGKQMDMCGSELMARIPKDTSIIDWKYDGALDPTVDFQSYRMFMDFGVSTIGGAWYRPKNIARWAGSINRCEGEGMVLLSYNQTESDKLEPEVIRALGLMSFLSWSPEECDLANLPFLTDAIVQAATYWPNVELPARGSRPLMVTSNLVAGSQLVEMLGLPAETDTSFLETPFENYRGVKFQVFEKDGAPAAIAVKGGIRFAYLRNRSFNKGLTDWDTQIPTGEGLITAENGKLKITRISGNAFMRASQDVRLDKNKKYVFRFKMKLDGKATAQAWAGLGDENFKWDKSYIPAYSSSPKWVEKEIKLPTGYGSTRISFSVKGDNSTAWFKDITLTEIRDSKVMVKKPVMKVNDIAEIIPVIKNQDFDEGLKEWNTQVPEKDGHITTAGQDLIISRDSGKAFMRAYQDVLLDKNREYILRFQTMLEGGNLTQAWITSGDENFKWDNSVYLPAYCKETSWTEKEIKIPSGYGSARISFSVQGDNATARFKDIEIVDKNAPEAMVENITIPVNSKAKAITFWHATDKQGVTEDNMVANDKKFAGVSPGEYVITYLDGSTDEIPLIYRLDIVAANDPAIGRNMDIGLFGTIGNTAFINLPTYTWLNPQPEKTIAAIEIVPGNRQDVKLLVFGISLD
jgi:hypothetical protein